jgi:hypothetical protein
MIMFFTPTGLHKKKNEDIGILMGDSIESFFDGE